MRAPIIKNIWLALAVVAGAQTLVLGYMLYDRIGLLQAGREVVLPVVPVDPRSLFQGDYVILSYAISRQTLPGLTGGQELVSGQPAYVTLAKAADGTWAQTAIGPAMPATLRPDDVVLRGRVVNQWIDGANRQVMIDYGIEQYFVEEGRGREIEEQVRDRKITVLLAVDSNGRAAIKALLADGTVRYREPLL